MPTIDNFIRPKEWVSEFLTDMGKVIRQWGEDIYIPIRRQVDEDWRTHQLIPPLMKEVLVDLGINSALFPAPSWPSYSVYSCRCCTAGAHVCGRGPYWSPWWVSVWLHRTR